MEKVSAEQLHFTGRGGEYFGVWIVNLLLTIVTLGIYSPWAKVRRLQYFYRHTEVAGSSFDFHGSPIRILIGQEDSPAIFGHAHVTICCPAFRIDRRCGSQVNVGHLEIAGTKILPPLQKLRLPVLESALQGPI